MTSVLWIISLLALLAAPSAAFTVSLSSAGRHSGLLAKSNDENDRQKNDVSTDRLKMVRLRASAELRVVSKRTNARLTKRYSAIRKSIVEKAGLQLDEDQISQSALDSSENGESAEAKNGNNPMNLVCDDSNLVLHTEPLPILFQF